MTQEELIALVKARDASTGSETEIILKLTDVMNVLQRMDMLERQVKIMSIPTCTEPFGVNYKNHRGEVAWRTLIPQFVHFGATEWHPEPQWLLRGLDLGKDAERDYALGDFLGSKS